MNDCSVDMKVVRFCLWTIQNIDISSFYKIIRNFVRHNTISFSVDLMDATVFVGSSILLTKINSMDNVEKSYKCRI